MECPACDQSILIRDGLADPGEEVECPACGASVVVSDTVRVTTKLCPFCSEEIAGSAIKCKRCGEFLDGSSAFSRVSAQPKSLNLYIVLGFFFGLLGVHNFYLGYTRKGIIQASVSLVLGVTGVALVVVAIWVLVELFTVREDANGVPFL